YARPFLSSIDRSLAAAEWTNDYNLIRPHTAIGGLTPWLRLNNLLGNDS
ncbi:MAG: transposase, partial [Devosia sp.]|nr:transposase [Devosia sp.]MBN9345990.1 transposase [Devosia sp.]